MVKKSTKWTLSVGCTGCGLILLGALLGWVGFPAIVEDTVADTVALKMDSDAWGRWVELPLPMQFKVTIFSCQNPKEVTEGKQPILKEMGPYVWTETRTKDVFRYDSENDTITYYQKGIFTFNSNLSKGSEDDLVTVVNIPLISFAQITDSIPALASSISSFNTAYSKMWPDQDDGSIFTTVSVKDYIFNGIKMNCSHAPTLQNLDARLLCAAYKTVAPKTVTIGESPENINYFSFFGYKNNTYDGRYTIRAGLEDVEKLGEVIEWEKSDHGDKWGGETCNRVQGTDSTIFRPLLQDVEELYIFNTDICRTVKLTYSDETEYEGISGRRYVADKNVFASALNNPDNYCYCPQSVNNLTMRGGCLKDGLLELSSCQGAPVILSLPYFLHGDESYQQFFPEFTPNVEEHQIYLDLEPYTGTPLRGASRIQMNVLLRPIKEVDMMKNFKGTILPCIWMEEGVQLTEDLLDMLHEELLDVLDILDIVRWVIVGVGIALVVGAIGAYIYYRKK